MRNILSHKLNVIKQKDQQKGLCSKRFTSRSFLSCMLIALVAFALSMPATVYADSTDSIVFPSSSVIYSYTDGIETKNVQLFTNDSSFRGMGRGWDGYTYDRTSKNPTTLYPTKMYKGVTATSVAKGSHNGIWIPYSDCVKSGECATGSGQYATCISSLKVIGVDEDGNETVLYDSLNRKLSRTYPVFYYEFHDSYSFTEADYEKYPYFKVGVSTWSNRGVFFSEYGDRVLAVNKVYRDEPGSSGSYGSGCYFHCYAHGNKHTVRVYETLSDNNWGTSVVTGQMFVGPAYTVSHYQEQNNGTAKLIESKRTVASLGDVVTPPVKDYVGFEAPDAVTVTLNEYVHAKVNYYYKKYKYKIKFNLNGGTLNPMPSDDAYWDEKFTVPNPTREGFEFQGWTITGMDDSNHKYGTVTDNSTETKGRKETTYSNLRVTPGEITFTAIWKDKTNPTLSIRYEKDDGSVYPLNTWTKATVTAIATGKDLGSGIAGIKWDDGEYIPENPSKKKFDTSGIYFGRVYTKDKADVPDSTYETVPANEVSIPYGKVMIDKTNPIGEISYGYTVDGTLEWFDNAETPTRNNVTVKITAKDEHSGLANTAYSWDHGKTWVSSNTKVLSENIDDYVWVRDKVGNIAKFPYSVSGIDKKKPTVEPVDPPKPDPDSPGNQESYDEDGTLIYDWVNRNVLLKFKAEDKPSDDPAYAASGVKEIRLYSAKAVGSTFTKGSLLPATSSTEELSYKVTEEGISGFFLEVEDNVGNITTLKLVVKIDKTCPQATVDSEQVNLNKFNEDNVEDAIKDNDLMSCYFAFNFDDKKALADVTDTSGIDYIRLRLINPEDPDNIVYGENCEFTVYRYGQTPIKLDAYKKTLENSSSLARILDPTCIMKDISVLSGTARANANSFALLPHASTFFWECEVRDRAGNAKFITSDILPNFSIKAVVHSFEDDEFNVPANTTIEINNGDGEKSVSRRKYIYRYTDEPERTYETYYKLSSAIEASMGLELLSSPTETGSVKLSNSGSYSATNTVPYFQLGDFGYMEVWTVGYVEKIQMDFDVNGQETVGKEMDAEITSSKVPGKYAIGSQNKKRYVLYSKADAVVGTGHSNRDDGVPYASHYGLSEETSAAWLDEGTSIRMPLYYALTPDGTKKDDGTDNYESELHTTAAYAWKNGWKDTSLAEYVIYDTRADDVHYRVTHE